ncbi:MAG: 30S ribosomal protein S11, partial [Candidatus Eisenbacteria bacterium]
MAEVKKGKKRDRKVGTNGVAHVQASFNNTIITITDMDGNVISWGSAGKVG